MRAALTLLVLLVLLPAAGAEYPDAEGALTWVPAPPRAGEPFTVRLTPDEGGVTNATLKVCFAEAGKATFCLLPKEMRRVREGVFEVDVADEIPAGQEIGLNATWRHASGALGYWPPGDLPVDEAYVFLTVQAAPGGRSAPALALPGVLAGVLLAGSLLHHNFQSGRRRLRP